MVVLVVLGGLEEDSPSRDKGRRETKIGHVQYVDTR